METYDICSRSKLDHHKPYGTLKLLLIPQGPWKLIIMNFIIKLSLSKDPTNSEIPLYDSILIVVDRFTKIAYFILYYETTNSSQLVHLVIRYIIAHHGVSTMIILGRGKLFISKFTKTLYIYLGIKQQLSIAYLLQTDRQTEYMNQTIK
jgi:hypothetical protein